MSFDNTLFALLRVKDPAEKEFLFGEPSGITATLDQENKMLALSLAAAKQREEKLEALLEEVISENEKVSLPVHSERQNMYQSNHRWIDRYL